MSISHRKANVVLVYAVLGIAGVLVFLFGHYSFMQINQANGQALQTEEVKSQLRSRIAEIEAEIEVYRSKIKNVQGSERTLQGQISVFENQIYKIQLEIEGLSLNIKDITAQLTTKEAQIEALEKSINREIDFLALNLRLMYQTTDSTPMLEVLLSGKELSDVLVVLNAYEDVQRGVVESLDQVKELKIELEDDREVLAVEQKELAQLRYAQEIQNRTLHKKRQDKAVVLTQVTGEKNVLIDVVETNKGELQKIRDQLYSLEGVGVALRFEDAYNHAKVAEELTGIRPAFLLALIKTESRWGGNVGTGNWREDMHPRDHDAFLQITERLGLDPDTVKVSKKPSYGWGGAMGPAQFLPATWLSYEKRVEALIGHTPDPWNIRDAFVASATKLTQAGAAARTEDAEWKSAQVYFAGSRWNKPAYYFYGDGIIELAREYQGQIDLITGVTSL